MSEWNGKVIRGYELIDTAGSGGFGTVFHARQNILEREVAVKIINEKYANEPEFVRQFETEARIIARLEHLHIVTLYDYWRDPSGAYLVMRWLRGGSLRQRLKQHRFTLPEIVRLLNQVGSALAFAHQQNVIHRDIKPENILLDDQDNAFLTDFGIAVDLRSTDDVAVESISFGSPEYIAPEQLTDKIVSPQSDVYSLGIMLYELLTHRRPFSGDTAQDILKMQLNNPVPSLKMLRPDLPTELDGVIWRATAKRPEMRYENVMAFAGAFQAIATSIAEVPPNFRLSQDTIRRAAQGSAADDSATTNQPGFEVDDSATGVLDSMATGTLLENGQSDIIISTPSVMATDNLGTMDIGFDLMRNPYKGLRPFEEADSDNFYGREDIVETLVQQFNDKDKRFLAVIGPSGSGKSSIVRAGILPELRRGAVTGSRNWFITTMVPGNTPFSELSEALLRVAIKAPDNWGQLLQERVDGLDKLLKLIMPDEKSELVLFIDQFEEVFTLSESEKERELFLGSLWYAMQSPNSRIRVIVTLRADFYDRPLYYAQFGELLRKNTEVVLPLNVQELEAAIIRPAEKVGLLIDRNLIASIIEDVQGQPGALPLLQYALTELYERRKGDRLSFQDYSAIGGISGALARRAAEIYITLDDIEKDLARQLFLRLITINEDGTATRRRILWQDMLLGVKKRAQAEAVVDHFSKYRLLTTDRDPVTRSPTIEIAHEALIAAWSQLRAWIEQNRADLQKLQQLRLAVDAWHASERDSSYLASGARLAEFEPLVNNPLLALHDQEREYIHASSAQRERSLQRTRILIGVLTVFSIVTFVLAIVAFQSQQRAEEARVSAVAERDRANIAAEIARSRELAASSLANRSTNDLALLLSVQSVETDVTYEAVNSLLTALQSNPFLTRYLYGHQNGVRSIRYSSDGNHIVSAGRDGQIIIRDTITGATQTTIQAHDAIINQIAISPDNRSIVSAGSDNFVRIWDMGSGEQLGELNAHESPVWSIAYAPDGETIASGDESGQVIVWDITTETIRYRIDAHTDIAYALAYSTDGSLLATGGGDNVVRLWDSATGETLGDLEGHNNWVLALAFNPVTNVLASAGADTEIILWDVVRGEPQTRFASGHRNWIRDLAFSSDGQILATASQDNSVRVWGLQTQQLIVPALVGHQDGVWTVAFHPSDLSLVTGSADHTVIQWRLALPQRPGTLALTINPTVTSFAINLTSSLFAAAAERANASGSVIQVWSASTNTVLYDLESTQTGQITRIAFSPDGTQLASAGTDGMIELWDMTSGEQVMLLDGHEGTVLAGVVYSSDGTTLYSADETGRIIQWDISTFQILDNDLYGQSTGITSIALSHDGVYLALGGRDTTIMIWDLSQNQLIQEGLQSHDDAVTALAFSSDNTRIVSGGRDNTIIVHDVRTGAVIHSIESGHSDWVLSLATSPDDELLASAGRDGTVRLWDFSNGRSIGGSFIGHQDWVNSLFFTEARTLLATSRNGAVIIWNMDINNWIERACAISGRTLTQEEWSRFLPDLPYEPSCSAIQPETGR